MLTLNEYREIIDLRYTPRPYTVLPEEEKSAICDELLGILLEERNEIAAFSYPYKTKRDLIWSYLNRRPPNPVSEKFLSLQDALFRSETAERGVVDVDSFAYTDSLTLWQGDITRLNADAVVTAANKSLLGCFIPHHHCIDNVIHSRAGVQVRLDGSRIIGAQGESPTHALVMLVFTVLYILRDQWVTFLRSVAAAYRADVGAMWLGKVRTALSFPAAAYIYAYLALHHLLPPACQGPLMASVYAVEGVLIALNVYSCAVYTRVYWPYLVRAIGAK